MTSPKKIITNRENAQKSTGPKTPEGKEVSKMNALQHGILTSHLFIPTSADPTDSKGFAAFLELFFEEMQPEGILETLLVDRLFATFWRLRRLHIAETGFIRKQVDPHSMQQALEKIEEHGNARKDVENGFFRRMRTSHGCSLLADHWGVIAKTVQERGLPLPEGMAYAVDWELGGRSGFHKAESFSNFNYIVLNKGGNKPLSADDEKKFNEYALECAKDLYGLFRSVAEVLELDEEHVQKADLQSKMLPPLSDLERLQRYDAHLQKTFLQTLHELQRIQAVRLGRPAPPSAALDVTLNSDGGFAP